MAEHFHALTVEEVIPETEEAVSIRFAVPYELQEQYRFKAESQIEDFRIDRLCGVHYGLLLAWSMN